MVPTVTWSRHLHTWRRRAATAISGCTTPGASTNMWTQGLRGFGRHTTHISVFFTQYIDVPLSHHFPGSLAHFGIRQHRRIRPRCRCGHDLTLYGRPFMFCVLYARITCHIQHTDTDLAHDRMHLVECHTIAIQARVSWWMRETTAASRLRSLSSS